jgi:TonB family protein
VEKLSNNSLQALRKYHANEFDDVYVSKENYDKLKKLSNIFIEEYKIGQVLNTVQSIDVKDIAKYINDSVTFIGKISGGKYSSSGKNSFTELSIGNALPKQLVTVVIKGTDRKNFGADPENYYQGKSARITGKAELLNKDKIQVLISHQDQLILIGDTSSITAANNSQPNIPVAKNPPVVNNEIVSKPQVPSRAPGFPGGYNVWIKFLNRNLKRPAEPELSEDKTVVVQFLVSAEGDVNDLKISQSAGPSFDAEVLRVMKRMPKWKPAIENGQPADAVVTQSITFVRPQELKSF